MTSDVLSVSQDRDRRGTPWIVRRRRGDMIVHEVQPADVDTLDAVIEYQELNLDQLEEIVTADGGRALIRKATA